MSAVIVRTKGKRGTITLSKPSHSEYAHEHPLLDQAAQSFDAIFGADHARMIGGHAAPRGYNHGPEAHLVRTEVQVQARANRGAPSSTARASTTTSAASASTRSRTRKPAPNGIEALLARLHRALEQQAAATTSANRRTAGGRAKRYRKALRLLGVESPPDRSVQP